MLGFLEILRVVGAFILILFFPGFFLVMALFPKKNELSEEDDWLYRIVLSVVLSIVVSIILAFIIGQLGINESTGKGYFTPEYIVPSLIAISIIFFIIGVFRGAYPMIYTHKSERVVITLPKEKRKELVEEMKQYRELEVEIKQLKSNLENDLSYKAKRRFKAKLKTKEEELAELKTTLKLE